MTKTGFRKLGFSPILYNILHITERRCSRKRKNQSLLSWVVSPMHKKSQPAAVVTRREQQEATTHCESEFENQIFRKKL